MRKIFQICIASLIMILLCNSVRAEVRNIQDNHKLIYTILESNGTSVTGQTPSLKIQKVSNGQWLDFDDLAFKASGWGNKTIVLSEDTDENLYYYLFNPPASETTAEQYAFLIENTNTTYKDHQIELVNYQIIGNGTSILTVSDNIGINWADISNPTTAQNLSGTIISPSQIIASVSGAVNSVTSGITVTTNNDKMGYSLSANQNAVTFGNVTVVLDKTGYSLSTAGITALWNTTQSSFITPGTFGYYLDSKVSEAGGGGLTVQDIVNGVLNETLANHTSTGSVGKKLSEMPTPYDIGP